MRWLFVVIALALLLSHLANAPSRERAKMLDEIDAAEEELRRNTDPVVLRDVAEILSA